MNGVDVFPASVLITIAMVVLAHIVIVIIVVVVITIIVGICTDHKERELNNSHI